MDSRAHAPQDQALVALFQRDPEGGRRALAAAIAAEVEYASPHLRGRVAVRCTEQDGLLVLADLPDGEVPAYIRTLLDADADLGITVCRTMYDALLGEFPPEAFARCFADQAARASREPVDLARSVRQAKEQIAVIRSVTQAAPEWDEGEDFTEVFHYLGRLIAQGGAYFRWALAERERGTAMHVQIATGGLALVTLLLPLHNFLRAAYGALEHQDRLAEFPRLVDRGFRVALGNTPGVLAVLARAIPHPGYALSVAGMVRLQTTMTPRLKRALVASVQHEGSDPPDLDRFLDERIAAVIPLALATWEPVAGESFEASLHRLRSEALRLIESEELEQDKQTTVHDREAGKRVARGKSRSLEALIDRAGDDDLTGLDTDRLGLFPADEEYLAYATVIERIEQNEAEVDGLLPMWRAAGLSERECAILDYDRRGYKPRDIAKQLDTDPNTVRVQKSRAHKKVETYAAGHALTGS